MSLIQLPTFRMRPDEQIVPLQYEHLFMIKLGPHEQEYERVIPGYRDYIYDISEHGWSWTAIGRGKVVACYGRRADRPPRLAGDFGARALREWCARERPQSTPPRAPQELREL